jgi:hypothetical protein
MLEPWRQRWASTLANRSNARHRSNIRAPPHAPSPLPPKCGNLCGQRGRERFIAVAGVSGCHIFVPAPHAPPPKGIGQRSKVVILPTTAWRPNWSSRNLPGSHTSHFKAMDAHFLAVEEVTLKLTAKAHLRSSPLRQGMCLKAPRPIDKLSATAYE